MCDVTKVDGLQAPEAVEATVEDAPPESSKRTRPMSWMGLGSFGRHQESKVSSGGWIVPSGGRPGARIVSMQVMLNGDGGRWDWDDHDMREGVEPLG